MPMIRGREPMIVETAVARRSKVQSDNFCIHPALAQASGQPGDAEGVKKHGLGDMGVKIRIDQYDISRPGLPCFFWTCLFIRGCNVSSEDVLMIGQTPCCFVVYF